MKGFARLTRDRLDRLGGRRVIVRDTLRGDRCRGRIGRRSRMRYYEKGSKFTEKPGNLVRRSSLRSHILSSLHFGTLCFLCIPSHGFRVVDENRRSETDNFPVSVALHVGKTTGQCIHRWSKSVRPNIARGKWSKEEDAQLILGVETVGPTWILVAPFVGQRTDAQCRERWFNVVNPVLLPYSVWSPEVHSFSSFFLCDTAAD